MEIVLVRHGQSRWQLSPSDDLDTPLSPAGHEQARLLGSWLADHPALDRRRRLEPSVLCSSPLVRARQTADHVSAGAGLPVAVVPSLREAPFHVVEELPQAAEPLKRPSEYLLSAKYVAFREQATNALSELTLMADQAGGPVLAVTHGGLIKTLLRVAMETDLTCFKLYNSAIVVIEWKSGRWRLVHLNLWDHLPSRLRTT